MNVKCYTLAKEDIERVREAGGPLAQLEDLSHVAEQMSVAVVEVDGRIVAYWVVFYALHAEPLWVVPEYRFSPTVIGGIVDAMVAVAHPTGERAVFSIVGEDEQETIGRYAERLGYKHQPGLLYYLMLQPATEPVEV